MTDLVRPLSFKFQFHYQSLHKPAKDSAKGRRYSKLDYVEDRGQAKPPSAQVLVILKIYTLFIP